MIPFSIPEIDESDVQAVSRVLRSGWLTTGSVSAELEEHLASYLGAEHVVTTSSCTAALEVALAYVGVEAKNVFVPTWTFASTANVPTRLGAQVTMIDVDPHGLGMDVDLLSDALRSSSGQSVVLPVHFAGVPVASDLMDVCADFEAVVIEDCAHALGAFRADGNHVGNGKESLGGAFSFYATKNITSGEGGCLATASDKLADFARKYRLHGLSADAWRRYSPEGPSSYELDIAGMKGNLPDILSALALSQLARFEDSQSRRRHLTELYLKLLDQVAGVHPLPSMGTEGAADHLFVVILEPGVSRELVLSKMRSAGVQCSVHFRPLHTFDLYKSAPMWSKGVADTLGPRAISLPMRPNLSEDDVVTTVTALATAISRSTP